MVTGDATAGAHGVERDTPPLIQPVGPARSSTCPIPPFILDLRAHVGHDPLRSIGVTATALCDGEVQLQRSTMTR